MIIPKVLNRFFCAAAAAASAFLGAAPQASAALPASESDIFLCFRATSGLGANTDYMVKLGPVSQFTAAGVQTVTIPGNILADLETIYGSDWKTRADVVWSVSGVQKVAGNGFPTNTMFASRAELSPGTQSEAWTRPSAFGAGAPALKMLSMRDPGYTAGTRDDGTQVESSNSAAALVQSVNAPNSYASYMPGGSNTTGLSAFGFFNAAGGIEATFENGTALSVLDFYKLEPGTGPGVLLGGFRLSDTAQLTFSSDVSFFAGPALVKFSADTYPVSEDAAGGIVTLTVQRSGNTDSAFTLNLTTADGSAVAGTDYVAQTNTPIVFAAGETTKMVDIIVVNRAGFQGDRSFTATLSVATGAPQLITPAQATINIIESTPLPAILALSAATYTVAENAGGGVVTVTVNRSGETSSAVTVNLSTQNGTATAGVDFTGQTDTVVSFAATETSKTVDIAVTNRAGFQGDRAFNVALSAPSAQAELGNPASAIVTIDENEPNPAGVIAFSASAYQFNATVGGQPSTLAISLSRLGGTTGAVAVNVSVTGGTLTPGEDFSFSSPATVNFDEGQGTAVVNIPMVAGAAPLPGTINLQIGNPTSGAEVGTPASATVTVVAAPVLNPDRVPPKLKVTSPRPGKSGATFDVAGVVNEPDDVDRVEVILNGGAPQLAVLGTKSGSSTPFTLAGLNAENGPNTLLVQAFDINGTASKQARVSFTYVNTRPQFAGLYTGLISPTGATPPGGDLNNASGLLTIKVLPTGAFTGKVLIGGAVLPIGGVFANDQTARFKRDYGSTLALATKGRAPVAFGELALEITATEVSGTLGGAATILAERAAFDGRSSTPDADYLANRGKYTAALPAKVQAALTASEFPQGDGIGALTLTKQGKLTFRGKLADGTPVSMSAPLSAGLKAPFYASLYKKKGSLGGVVTLDKTAADSDVEGADFLWLRPAISNAKHYPNGWPEGVEVDFVGARYAVPSGTSVLPGLGAEDPVMGNATLTAEDGKLTGPVNLNVSVSPRNKVTNVPANDRTFKVGIAAPTGAISGFFPHTDGSKTKFFGVILQKGANEGGFGYFLSNVPRGGASGESGGISLSAK